MNLEETRTTIADVLSDLDPDISVTSHPVTNNVRPGDGWVIVTRFVPTGYTELAVTFQVILILATDALAADRRLDDVAGPLMEALTTTLDGTSDVSIEPLSLVASGTVPGTLYAAQATFTMEVEQ